VQSKLRSDRDHIVFDETDWAWAVPRQLIYAARRIAAGTFKGWDREMNLDRIEIKKRLEKFRKEFKEDPTRIEELGNTWDEILMGVDKRASWNNTLLSISLFYRIHEPGDPTD
jgi:hypothetical protein